MEDHNAHLTRSRQGKNDERKKTSDRRGARESAPAGPAKRWYASLPRLRNNRAAMHHVFHVGKERTGCREAVRPFASGFYSAQISKRAV